MTPVQAAWERVRDCVRVHNPTRDADVALIDQALARLARVETDAEAIEARQAHFDDQQAELQSLRAALEAARARP